MACLRLFPKSPSRPVMAVLAHSKVVRSMQYASGRMRNGRKIHASISEQRGGYKVTVSITENKETRELIARTVPSRFEAETIAKAFASHFEVPWYKVEVSSG